MSKYTFTFKKDDIFVEFATSDKEVVEKQFQIWVADADEYASKHPKIAKPKQEKTEPKSETKAELKIEPKAEPKPQVIAPEVKEEEQSIEAPLEKPETETLTQEKAVEIAQSVSDMVNEPEPEVFDKASSLLKTINSIQDSENKTEVEQESPKPAVNFDEILEKTIETIPEEPSENASAEQTRTKDPVFLNLINSKNTTDKFHYLMITAYYLLEFEKLERFSLKQINAKLMQNLSEVIDHSTLQEAINQGFIELVPDLTGTSEVGEYRITPIGEDFFANIA